MNPEQLVVAKWVPIIGSRLRRGDKPSDLQQLLMSDAEFCEHAIDIVDAVTGDSQVAAIIRTAARRAHRRTVDPMLKHPHFGRF